MNRSITRSPDHRITGLVLITALLLCATPAVEADLPPPVTSDFDAEFAHAADLLERGDRAQAEALLAQIRSKAGQPAWDARSAFLLAGDDMKRGSFASAARRLADAPASTIGLEPYRRYIRGRALASAGNPKAAASEFRAAVDSDEPFASRVDCARALSVVLERQGARAEALDVLSAVAPLSGGADATAVAVDRVRIGLAARKPGVVSAAARDLVLSGVDPGTLPAHARAAVQREELRLAPADRAAVGRLALSTDASRAARLLAVPDVSVWPASERAWNILAAARAQARLGHAADADRIAAAVPEDGTSAVFEARLLRADLALARLQKGGREPAEEELAPLRRVYGELSAPPTPASVRASARERLIRLDCDARRFDDALEVARGLAADTPGSTAGFEPLWRVAWETYRSGDAAGARRRMEGLATVYRDTNRVRRLTYWRARCLEREQRAAEARPLYESLASADPGDLYALFSRRRVAAAAPARAPAMDPIPAGAEFRRADELLRLRLFEEAADEARALPSSRGRELRLAEAEFAQGRFSSAAAAVRRAFPELGTADEGRVPDAWRRLYYPIEPGAYLARRARQFGIDPAILRGLVRQESVFDPSARSRAGALGLTQLMPSTAKSLSRSVLRVRYRRAFLYDPASNAQLGAAYLRQLVDRFGGNPVYALAAYNGGPTRMARVLRENPGMPEDEIFESHPAYETRDYVRRVLLYAESYRQLYPGEEARRAFAGAGDARAARDAAASPARQGPADGD
jgi:soluble lytic murein transglycosylase-like protein